MKFEPRQIPEGINTSPQHPLRELFLLLAGAGAIIAVALFVLVLVSDYLVRFIPLKTERQWFDLSHLDVAVQQDSRPEHQQVERYLQHLVEQLNQSDDRQMQFDIHLIDGDVPNAFITPGGHIFVTRKLLSFVHSENALAMVIAHEMAHQYHRDPIRSLGRGTVVAIALMVVAGVDGSEWVSEILTNSVNLGLLAYSRDQEREADRTGLQLLVEYYGHAGGSDEFFRQLQKHDGLVQKGWQQYISTHPNTDERIAMLSTAADAKSLPLTPLPETVTRLVQTEQ
jgi:predicted Zn-dependent protease